MVECIDEIIKRYPHYEVKLIDIYRILRAHSTYHVCKKKEPVTPKGSRLANSKCVKTWELVVQYIIPYYKVDYHAWWDKEDRNAWPFLTEILTELCGTIKWERFENRGWNLLQNLTCNMDYKDFLSNYVNPDLPVEMASSYVGNIIMSYKVIASCGHCRVHILDFLLENKNLVHLNFGKLRRYGRGSNINYEISITDHVQKEVWESFIRMFSNSFIIDNIELLDNVKMEIRSSLECHDSSCNKSLCSIASPIVDHSVRYIQLISENLHKIVQPRFSVCRDYYIQNIIIPLSKQIDQYNFIASNLAECGVIRQYPFKCLD
jgi:hypothetical protein